MIPDQHNGRLRPVTRGNPGRRLALTRTLAAIENALWRLCGPGGPLTVFFPVLSPALERLRRVRWNTLWKIEGARPASQLSTAVPKELMEAVASGWIPAGSSVMDIGSGRGQVSAWLAERGFRVLGADLSAEATELARQHFQTVSATLEFRTMDICDHRPEAARFDALIDRGCFHIIPDALRPRYAANVAGWAKTGARFLLLAKQDGPEDRMIADIRALFDPCFELVRTGTTVLSRSAGPFPRIENRALVCWMVRRGSERGPGS